MNRFTKKAFTLAETLIVMGIIGIIATLTIPSLTTETNSKDKITKLKKNHSILEEAYGRMTSLYGPLSEWTALNTTSFTSTIVKAMKVTKNCRVTNNETCFNAAAKTVDSTSDTINSKDTYGKVILADGSSVAFTVFQTGNKDCALDVTSSNTTMPDLNKVCGYAVVDVDGPNKGKSQYGVDMFGFYLTRNGFYPFGNEADTKYKSVDNCLKDYDGTAATSGRGCAAWVIANDSMDYVKCGGSSTTLNWSVVKCP